MVVKHGDEFTMVESVNKNYQLNRSKYGSIWCFPGASLALANYHLVKHDITNTPSLNLHKMC